MSSKKTKRGESGGGKSLGSTVAERSPPVTPTFEGIDPSTLPFSEWSDEKLNAEKWDMPKSKVA